MSEMTERRGGFSLVEVMFAILILTVAVLTMGATTAHLGDQLAAGRVMMLRETAYQRAIERLQMASESNFANVVTRAEGDAIELNGYDVWWTVEDIDWGLKGVTVVTRGADQGGGRLTGNVKDSVVIRLARPYRP